MPLAPSAAATPKFNPPAAFDGYELLERLGRGGMGEVFLARDALLGRLVAVKFISEIEPDPTAAAQFFIEARAAARIQHPNVVTIYRVGQLQDRPFIISEYVRGQSLDTVPL